MKKCFLFVVLFSFYLTSFGQGNKGKIVDIVIHRVELGETIVMISKKYLVNPTTIYNSNKFIIDGVNEGMMLQIPVARKAGQEYATMQYQEPIIGAIPDKAIALVEKTVEKEEDTTTIAMNEPIIASEPVAVVEVKEPELESKKGAITRIEKDEEVLDESYTVQPRETLYSISKKYNIPMDVIMAENQDALKNGIIAGIKLKIPGVKKADIFSNVVTKVDGTEVKPIKETLVALESTNLQTGTDPIANANLVADKIVAGVLNHTVSPKETLYSLATTFNVSVEQLTAFNESIQKFGLKVGDVIKVPTYKNGVIVAATNSDLKVVDVVTNPVVSINANTTINQSVAVISKSDTIIKSVSETNNANNQTLEVNSFDNKPKSIADIVVNAATNQTINTDSKAVDVVKKDVDVSVNDVVNHTVAAKETLFSLSKKFNISVEALKSFNADVLKNGLAIGTVIKIPKANSDLLKTETAVKANDDIVVDGVLNHIITTKETLFSLSKKFNVSVENLKAFNDDLLKNGFAIGSVIKIPNATSIIPKVVDKTVADVTKNGITIHTVATNETMFSIAKKHNTTIEALNALNEDIVKNGIAIGAKIKIPVTQKVKDTLELTSVADVISKGVITHTVASGETLYSLSKTYNVSVEQINAYNENIDKVGLSIGSVIKLPVVKAGAAVDPNGIIAALDKKIAEFVMPTRTTEKNEIIHKVVSGQTLFSLSKKYNVSVYDIRSNNENILKSGLQIGQNIKIPVIKKVVPPTVTDDGIVVVTPGIIPTIKTDQGDALVETYVVGDIIMTVQKDDTIESIAAKYEVTPEEIIKNNALLIKDGKVKPGQVIKVPATKTGSIEFSPETFD